VTWDASGADRRDATTPSPARAGRFSAAWVAARAAADPDRAAAPDAVPADASALRDAAAPGQAWATAAVAGPVWRPGRGEAERSGGPPAVRRAGALFVATVCVAGFARERSVREKLAGEEPGPVASVCAAGSVPLHRMRLPGAAAARWVRRGVHRGLPVRWPVQAAAAGQARRSPEAVDADPRGLGRDAAERTEWAARREEQAGPVRRDSAPPELNRRDSRGRQAAERERPRAPELSALI
jgi:hypothetical protein